MCMQKTALEFIKSQKDKGGMSDAALLLHEKQCEDTELMNKRIDDIEKKLDGVDKKVDELKILITTNKGFGENLKEILNNKAFIYLLITIICACFGVSVGEVGTFIFK